MKSSLKSILILVLLCSTCILSASIDNFIPTIDSLTNMIIDDDGRERFFHGTNIVVKGQPYHPQTDSFDSEMSFCDEDMELLRSMGHNSIRLSLPW